VDGRSKLPPLLCFYTGLAGEVVIFVMTEFFHHPVDSTLVTMLGGLLAIGVANGAMSKDRETAAPPPPSVTTIEGEPTPLAPTDIGGVRTPQTPSSPPSLKAP